MEKNLKMLETSTHSIRTHERSEHIEVAYKAPPEIRTKIQVSFRYLPSFVKVCLILAWSMALFMFSRGSTINIHPSSDSTASKQLIWTVSLGSMKGSPQWLWLRCASSANFADVIEKEILGSSCVY